MRINLYETFRTDTMRNRETAQRLFQMAKEGEPIVIDFKGTVFASRAFCHELHTLMKGRDVRLENMDKNVKMMFEALKMPKPKLNPRRGPEDTYGVA